MFIISNTILIIISCLIFVVDLFGGGGGGIKNKLKNAGFLPFF